MGRTRYYRVNGNVWHWMPTCSRWPVENYDVEHSASAKKWLCPQCKLKELDYLGANDAAERLATASASAGALLFAPPIAIGARNLSSWHPSRRQALLPSTQPNEPAPLRSRPPVCSRTDVSVQRYAAPGVKTLCLPSANIDERVVDTLGDHQTWLPSLRLQAGVLMLSATERLLILLASGGGNFAPLYA
jgi:hypothetical protein